MNNGIDACFASEKLPFRDMPICCLHHSHKSIVYISIANRNYYDVLDDVKTHNVT